LIQAFLPPIQITGNKDINQIHYNGKTWMSSVNNPSGRIKSIWNTSYMSNTKLFRIILLFFSILFLVLSGVILVSDRRDYLIKTQIYAPGTSINGIPLGGLDRSQAAERLNSVFSLPIELRYNGARMQFLPADLGFSVNIEGSLDELEKDHANSTYWAHLWGKSANSASQSDLIAHLDTQTLINFLNTTISPRYDQPPSEPLPIINTTHFKPGQGGSILSKEDAVEKIKAGLSSINQRIIDLPVSAESSLPLRSENLLIFLKQLIELEQFDGLVEIYLEDLDGELDLQLAVKNYESVIPDAAFSAGSTIKIPIMMSVLKRSGEPKSEDMLRLMERMIVLSENPPADALMSRYIDEDFGPLLVTDDLQALQYENSFLAGYFAIGSPLLKLYKTAANTRTDIFLDPDIYNQTVPSEIGDLLAQIYRCANPEYGQSKLDQVFGDEISNSECQIMLDLLSENQIGMLVEAGLPPEGSFAHKHGWTTELDGLIHSISDVGIVSSPGGDYVLTIFMHTQEQLIFDKANWLFAKLSQSIYNAFNLDDQTYWWIE